MTFYGLADYRLSDFGEVIELFQRHVSGSPNSPLRTELPAPHIQGSTSPLRQRFQRGTESS